MQRAPSAKITLTKLASKMNDTSRAGLTAVSTPTPTTTPVESPSATISVHGNASVTDRYLHFADFEEDDDSAMSGLTDNDCATVDEAGWKLTEFLRTETENIKRILDDSAMSGLADIDCATVAEAGWKLTENIKRMLGNEPDIGEDDDYRIFTHNKSLVSGDSDRVGKVAREAEEMVKEMAEATAWMNDPTLLESESDSESEVDDSDKPAWVAFWSDDHEREYYHNVVTNQTFWTKPQGVEIDDYKVEC